MFLIWNTPLHGTATNSGLGGGGKGGAYYQGVPVPDRRGTAGTGGGGGGGIQTGPRTPLHPNAPQPAQGGDGGSGVVIVAYQIGSTGSAKATGGAISFYGGKPFILLFNLEHSPQMQDLMKP